MKNLWGQEVPTLLFSARLKETVADTLRARRMFSGILILVALMLFSAVSASAQDSFATPEVLPSVVSYSITNDNTGIGPEIGVPSLAGYAANAPLWYVWTAPQSGEVEMDTMGSIEEPLTITEGTNIIDLGFTVPLDTVMGVFTGNSLSSLTQIAANDDLYPFPQENETYPQNIYDVVPGTNALGAPAPPGPIDVRYGIVDLFEPYSGPSGLRFNAVGGQTYYIAVDSKTTQFSYIFGNKSYNLGIGLEGLGLGSDTGPIVLTFAYKPSGVFRIATENFDETGNLNTSNSLVPPPLIPTCQTETSFSSLDDYSDHGWTVDSGQQNIQLHSYYPYNVAGVPVTITRVGGSSGRIWLTYSTEDGNTNLIFNGDEPAIAGRDYTPETNQTLIFDDGEMSKTIYVPIIDNSVAEGGVRHPNRDFTLNITGVQPDPYEDTSGDAASISPPRIDSNFGQTEVKILDVDIDPNGPANSFLVTTNPPPPATNGIVTTNVLWTIQPTNAILNFGKVNYRFPRDVTNYWHSGHGGTLVTIWVERRGTNTAAVTANWSVDNGYLADNSLGSDWIFPLEPASDYANPDPATLGAVEATNSDFSFSAYSGTVSFPDATSGHAWDPQPIQFLVYDNGNATLDKDFIVDLFEIHSPGNVHLPCGMVNQTKVTILADRAPVTGGETPADNRLPAGSVDENYNIDFGLQMAPSINTTPQNNPEPGTDGEVDGLVVLTNNETLAVGDFDSYNGVNRFGICLINTDGTLDQSFNPGSGVNVRDGYAIDCVAATPNNQQVVIGGSFTSYNGQNTAPVSGEGGLARVNLNGSIDTSFAAGVNGTVYAVAVQPNGQVLIGGDFTQVDGTPCAYVARLNANGSLDTSFNPGQTLTGPVYALSPQQTAVITTNVVSTSGIPQENDATININSNDVGNVTVNYIFPTANEMQVFYGGNLIYDTGVTTTGAGTPARFSVPYGPGSTPLVLVVNPGGAIPTGTNYSYAAAITGAANMPEVMVGGNFSVYGQNYANIALFNTNGGLDVSFNPTLGADQPIYAMDWQPDGKVLIGGDFQNFNAIPINRFARLNADGSLDTTNFYVGYGADDTVFCVKYLNPYTLGTQTNFSGVTNAAVSINRSIYIGGQFSSYNGTHRLGFARLYTDGTVDTTFMDSTMNQFAGLPKIYSYDAPSVHATGVQSDGGVMIGGSFNEVGGGEAEIGPRAEIDQQEGIAQSFTNQWLWVSIGQTDVEPNSRDGVRNRGNIARLVGGATPGPGNLMLVPDSSSGYQANRNQVIQPVSLIRTNGYLGPESANFSIASGTAQNGSDLIFQAAEPLDYLSWEYAGQSRLHTDGLAGYSGFENNSLGFYFSGGVILASEVNVTILPDANVAGNLSATYQLANPANVDQLYLGGEDIPVGTALGLSSSAASFIDNSQQAGTFGFASTTFVATNLSPQITVVRNNGAYGTVNVNYSTNSPNGGTAMENTDYSPIKSTTLTFLQNQLTNIFSLSVKNAGVVYTGFTEKTINLQLTSLRPPGNGATLGISNTVVRLINPNFAGYLTLSATNYTGLEAPPAGQISFTVNRVAGSQGSVSVQYALVDGSAKNGQDYIGAPATLQWNNGDVSPRTVTLPLINSGLVGINKQFSVQLSNPQLNDSSDSSLFYSGSPGSITSATMSIIDNNSYGSVQFSSPNYLVNENGGYATITVVRSGGVAGPAYVSYATSDGPAVSGANYVATSGVLTFYPNQLSTNFVVAITNNGQTGPAPTNFYFNVTLSSPVNLALGTLTGAQVDILNAQSYNQPPGTTNANFSADINGDVLALAYQANGQIIAGGSFNSVNGLTANSIVRLNADSSVDTSFGGSANGNIQTVASQTDNRILVGGQFTSVDGTFVNNIARFMTDGTLDTSFDVGAGADEPVYSLVETFIGSARKIYVGGEFSTINSVGSEGIARLNNNGTVDGTFNVGAGVDGTVYAIAVYPTNSVYAGDVIIGGSFVHYNGAVVNGLARLQSNGSVDVGFNPGSAATNGTIYALAIQPDGKVLVGGAFTNFNSSATTNITRLNDDGSTDITFLGNAGLGANATVDNIVLQPDSRILVMGQFSQFNGLVRNGVTRLQPWGATDPTINFGTGANGAVDTALIDPNFGLITLGGAFTAFNGSSANHIVQLYGLSALGSGAFEFTSPSYQVTADGVVVPISIVRVGGTSGTNSDGSGNIYVNFSTVNNSGTAVPNVDYVPISTNVAFPPGAVVETVNVHVMTDPAATGNLNVGLLLTNATPPAIITNQPTALLTILNVNNTVSFTSTLTNIFENVPGGIANIAIARQGSTNGACSVDFYTSTNGTAIPGVDFYPTNETITFNPGVTEQSAQVLIISNSAIEKTVGMFLTNSVSTTLIAPTNETMTIINNSTSPGQLCFAATNYTVNESAGTVTVYVVRTNGFAGTVSYGYTTLAGTAQPNINFTPTNGTVQFNAATTIQPITVPLLQYNPPEGPVTFSIVLTNTTTTAATLVAPTNTTVTIMDDISTGVSFINATNFVGETNGPVSVLVQRVGNTNSAFSVPFFTTNGTAVAGVNYVTNRGVLPFTPGESVAGISVTLMNQESVSNLTFGLSLLPPNNSVQLLSPSNSLVFETPAAAGITFTSATNSVYKNTNSGSITIPVVCLDPNNEPPILNSNSIPLSVSFSTTNGTGLAGVDYVATNGILTFTNGMVTNTITVSIINNSLISGLRTFGVNLSNVKPVPPGKLVSPTNQIITIIDGNSGLEFSSANYSIDRGGIVPITVLRVDNTNTTSSVNYATVVGGSAVGGTDYYPTNGVLTFAPGQVTNGFNVTIIGSSSVEPDKTILMQLSNPTNGILTAPSVATLTIENQNGSYVVPAGVSLFDTNGAPNGILQTNQQADLNFGFRDAGGLPVSSMTVSLLPNAYVQGGSQTQPYGALTVNGPSAFRKFSLTPVNTTNGQTVMANFSLTVNSVGGPTTTQTNSFALTIGSWTTTWSNTNAIVISGATNNNSVMMASPYPSVINVTNVGGVLVGVTATLTNFSDTAPPGVEVLLVAPDLADTMLMSGVGSSQQRATSVTLTFSNCVPPVYVPFSAYPAPPVTITNGVYNPTIDGITIFP